MREDPTAEHRVELETKISYQDKAIADLNDALVDQTKTLLELKQQVAALETVVRSISQQLALGIPRLPHEKPPHY
ncbi:SlyX family protein [Myxococcota bacterium]